MINTRQKLFDIISIIRGAGMCGRRSRPHIPILPYLLRSYLFVMFVMLVMATACSSATPTPVTMAGFWEDNARNVTTVKYQDGEYVAVVTYYWGGAGSQNSLVSSSYTDGVLTWKYCPPAKTCITMQTVAFNGDTLDVTWTDADGASGQMTLTRTDRGQWYQSND